MSFKYIDVHSHPYFPDYDGDREEEMQKIKAENIATISIGVDFETSKQSIELAKKYSNVFSCVGYHPGDLKIDGEELPSLEVFLENKKENKIVTIGECGLDYFRLPEDEKEQIEIKKIQKDVFESQINLALKYNLPLMLHIRPKDKISFDAYKDVLDILEPIYKKEGEKLTGNVHFFIGDLGVLKRFLSIGFKVSFGGVLTFTNEYDEYVKYAPLDMILSETDAPFVAPVPFRGKRNSPLYVPIVVENIARIKGEKEEVVRESMVKNALALFPGLY
jgi:TatD DNase family protein